MPSQLYQNALNRLGAAAVVWNARLAEIQTVRGPDPSNQNGNRIAELIQSEEQLSSDPGNQHPDELIQFIHRLNAITCGTANTKRFADQFDLACKPSERLGQPIADANRPGIVYRYILAGAALFELIASSLSSSGFPTKALIFRKRIAEARNPSSGVTWNDVADLLRSADIWDYVPKDQIKLHGGTSTFVTFDGPNPIDRSSGRDIFNKLALWLPGPPVCFLEAKYPPSPALVLHFPTIADAKWYKHFQGVRHGAPHGWTKPHSGDDQQPEAVQVPPTLADLRQPTDIRVLPPVE